MPPSPGTSLQIQGTCIEKLPPRDTLSTSHSLIRQTLSSANQTVSQLEPLGTQAESGSSTHTQEALKPPLQREARDQKPSSATGLPASAAKQEGFNLASSSLFLGPGRKLGEGGSLFKKSSPHGEHVSVHAQAS